MSIVTGIKDNKLNSYSETKLVTEKVLTHRERNLQANNLPDFKNLLESMRPFTRTANVHRAKKQRLLHPLLCQSFCSEKAKPGSLTNQSDPVMWMTSH